MSRRVAMEWDEALEVYFKANPNGSQPSSASSFLANMPCPNWHLFNANGYLATVKHDGRVTYNGPQGRHDKRR